MPPEYATGSTRQNLQVRGIYTNRLSQSVIQESLAGKENRIDVNARK